MALHTHGITPTLADTLRTQPFDPAFQKQQALQGLRPALFGLPFNTGVVPGMAGGGNGESAVSPVPSFRQAVDKLRGGVGDLSANNTFDISAFDLKDFKPLGLSAMALKAFGLATQEFPAAVMGPLRPTPQERVEMARVEQAERNRQRAVRDFAAARAAQNAASNAAAAAADRATGRTALGRDPRGGQAPGEPGAGGGGAGGGRSGDGRSGGACFAPGTMIKMAAGHYSPIEELQIGDETAGGAVTGVMQFEAPTLYRYFEVVVSGEQAVLEADGWTRIEESRVAIPYLSGNVKTVHDFDCTDHRIYIGDHIFADFAEIEADHSAYRRGLRGLLDALNESQPDVQATAE